MLIAKLASSYCRHCGQADKLLLGLVFVFLAFGVSSAQQNPSQDQTQKQEAEIGGVKFGLPQDFKLEQSPDSEVAFMRHAKYETTLFVVVPNRIDDAFLEELSKHLVLRLVPQESGFEWKMLKNPSDHKVSKHQ